MASSILTLVACGDRSDAGRAAPAIGETASAAPAGSAASAEDAASADPAASSGAATPRGSAPADLPSLDGEALLAKFQCARCHEGLGGAPLPREKRCVACHQDILAGNFVAPAKDMARWKKDIVHFRVVPSLANLGHRLDPAFVERYLMKPFTVRPLLGGTMPRLAISEAEARVLAAHLTRTDDAPADGARVVPGGDATRGRALFGEKNCASCHAFTGVVPPSDRKAQKDAERLAPDLRFARERLRRDQLVDWIADPEKIRKGSLMTRLVSSRKEAEDLAAYVAEAPLTLPPVDPPARPPPLDRPVGYDEVAARVFKKTCWHCHSQPDFARGDGGPGNTGGFGFAGKRVDLSSYESMLGGYLGDDGQRRSLFSTAEGEPILLRVLFARHVEAAGGVDTVRGMPLGIEPVSIDDYRAVARWIADGHPR